MPKMEQRDVHNAFVILLPVVWVLLDKGEACRAEKVFLHYVCDNYDKFYGDDTSSSTYYFYLYKPLRYLLRLACDESSVQTDVRYEDIEKWIFGDDFCTIQRYLASYMCALGKDSNCILAEICCLLAPKISKPAPNEINELSPSGGVDDDERRQTRRATLVTSNSSRKLRIPSVEERQERILRKGLDHAKISMQDTEGQVGYDYARQQILRIKERLRCMSIE